MRGQLVRAWDWLKDRVEGDRPVPVAPVLARTYLRGSGLEIGALHNPLPVPAHARVRYVDRMSRDDLRTHYPDLAALPLVNVDVVDDGERLATVPDGSQDFVVANHFLEHCQDPIRVLGNFFRVLRPGGVAYMAVPDKRYTFDRDRPVTPLDHLRADHAHGPERSRVEHYREYAKFVHKCETDTEAEGIAADLMRKDYSIHFHVWTQKEMLELMVAVKDSLGFDVEACVKNRHEVIFVLRKHGTEATA
jgi:predicted SAM-dependent methyltransferase